MKVILVIFETLKNLLLSLVGLSSAEPFWKYDRPERFVKWATEAIPQIIAEGVRDGLDWKSCANIFMQIQCIRPNVEPKK